jgi:hypothetical protein
MKPFLLVALAGLFLAPTAGLGQKQKKEEKKVEPQVLVALPLGAAPGSTVKFTFRGLKLDNATAVRFTDDKAAVKLLSKGKAAVPDKNPEKVGDTQVVAEVTLPAELPSGRLEFVIETKEGTTKPHALLVEKDRPILKEKEPNDGFRQAQPMQIPQVVDGLIERPRDVDVFRIEGKAGQKLVLEVFAARHGSALDSLLTLYDADGQQVATNDDANGSLDSRLEVTLPKSGTFYLSLIDAHDTGGPAHVYWLVARSAD